VKLGRALAQGFFRAKDRVSEQRWLQTGLVCYKLIALKRWNGWLNWQRTLRPWDSAEKQQPEELDTPNAALIGRVEEFERAQVARRLE
jgi:hypothetical protein